MDLVKIAIIFFVIAIIIRFNKPLYISILGGIVTSLVLYKLPISAYPVITKKAIIGEQTIIIVSAFYTITFLQRMLEKRGRLILAEKSISRIFNSRRVNATIVPFIIGLLPSAGAVLIASPIVVSAAGEYLDKDETTFVTTYYRHISESFVPTYSSIILALTLTGINMTSFVVGMLPLVFALFAIGYFIYVRKIPSEKGALVEEVDYVKEWKNVFKSMWAIVLAVLIILIFKIPVHYAVIGIIVINFFIDKFTINEIKPFFKTAFEPKLIFTTFAVMGFKEILIYTGVIERLPDYFVALPINLLSVYAILFFLGTIIVGSQAMIVTLLPLAYGSLNNIGLPYFILLMSLTYIAMQVSPTHVCLGIITEHTGTTFNNLVKKTVPVLLIFIVVSVLYTYSLSVVMGW